ITPALTSSSLNLVISVSIFSSGRTPASESLLAFTATRNRISVSPLVSVGAGVCDETDSLPANLGSTEATNEPIQNRHGGQFCLTREAGSGRREAGSVVGIGYRVSGSGRREAGGGREGEQDPASRVPLPASR